MSPATLIRRRVAASVVPVLYRTNPGAAQEYVGLLRATAEQAFAKARTDRERAYAHAKQAEWAAGREALAVEAERQAAP